jgi:hypothetical protein
MVDVEAQANSRILLFLFLSATEKSIQVCSYLCILGSDFDASLKLGTLFDHDLAGSLHVQCGDGSAISPLSAFSYFIPVGHVAPTHLAVAE